MDKRLDDSLGAFDAQLRTEQQRTAEERDAHRATGASGTAAEPAPRADTATAAESSEDPSGAATQDAGKSTDSQGGRHRHGDTGDRTTRPGDLKSDKTGGPGGNGARAREVPDGSDDDIVARRLRKAAEQETDPELREKLWKEYVEYKKNAQGQ